MFLVALLCLKVWSGLFSGCSDWGVARGLGWYGWVGLARASSGGSIALELGAAWLVVRELMKRGSGSADN